MQTLVEDFLQNLRHDRGQAEHMRWTYAALLGKFTDWAGKQGLTGWKQVGLKHLMAFLQHERDRSLMRQPKDPRAGSAARVCVRRFAKNCRGKNRNKPSNLL